MSLGQKNTLVKYMLLSGADNRPPMLDKDLYDSWKSRMELYIQNKDHGRMIIKSVKNGPLIWPTISENGVTRTKKYAELSTAEKIQVDCDMKATNIILQVLPADIFSLVNHHRPQFDHSSVPPSYPYQSKMNHQTSYVLPLAYQSHQASTQPMTESPLVDSGFAFPIFSLGDDLIAYLNKAMAFQIAEASLRFPSTNNQLRTSSNLRNQSTIQDGKPKRPRNAAWYKEKAMLAEAQEAGQILDEEQLAFFADPGVQDGQAIQTIISNNASFQTKDLDTYDS
nr:hypothetical protein [Tanacetum cinerariifolium]